MKKETYEKIIGERDEIISNLEKDLETQIDKLDRLVDQINTIKTVSKDLIDIVKDKENEIIANIANFLYERGNKKEAKAISKCKIGEISFARFNSFTGYHIEVKVTLYCTGDTYDYIKDDFASDEKQIIMVAMKAFFTESYVRKMWKHFRANRNQICPINIDSLFITPEYNIKRINPKESDIELFFEKVDRLKKMLKSK